MKKLLIIAALLPALVFGQQAKNVQVASGETFDENNIVVSAGGTRLKSIPIVWTSGNSTLSLTGNITLTGNVTAVGLGGATANGQFLIGNATSGDFQIGNITAGSGISLTPGAGTLQVSANQSLFQSVKVSGQNDIIATSPTANITFSATGGLVATTNNTTNTITLDASGISSAGFSTGMTVFIPDADSPPSGWALAGAYGAPAFTTPDADYKAIYKTGGTVAAVTANVSAGEVLTGTQVLFETSTPSAAIRYTTNGTDPTRTSGTVVSGPVTVSADTTYEVIGYRDYWVDTAVGSFAYTVNPIPTHSGAWTIASDGDTHTLVFSEAISFGAGGSGGFVANMSGGAVNLTYSSGTGTNTIVFTGNRTVTSSETETGNNGQYTQPGNGAEDSAGQDVATFTGHTITNNSAQGGASYIYDLDFEGTGAPSGWTGGAGNDFDYSADPLEGSQSLRITGPGVYAYASLNNTQVWGKMKVRVGALGANNKIVSLINSGFTERLQVAILSGGELYVTGGGSSAQTTDTMSANTEYFVWWHYNGSTVVSVEFSTTDSRVGSGTKFASTTGTNDTITTIFLYCDASTTADFDNVKVDDADIP